MSEESTRREVAEERSSAITRTGRILLIEDEAETANDITADLSERGHHVKVATDGVAGLNSARGADFDLLIVDRMLPEMEGLAVIEALRREGVSTPVLVLSALDAVDDRVLGLKAGGDDYLTKPFALVELAARVDALLRRPLDARQTSLAVGPLMLDLIERQAWRSSRQIDLLPREFKILEYMMRRPDQVITRDMLLEDVWGYRFLPQSNLVDVHVSKLRRKIDSISDIPLIRSVRGAGFMLMSLHVERPAPEASSL
jgi:two-component system, OmpR family, response regulator